MIYRTNESPVTVNDDHSAEQRPATPNGPHPVETEKHGVPPAEEAAGDEDGETEGGNAPHPGASDENSGTDKDGEPPEEGSEDERILPYWLYPD
jgi:hypothetical protein